MVSALRLRIPLNGAASGGGSTVFCEIAKRSTAFGPVRLHFCPNSASIITATLSPHHLPIRNAMIVGLTVLSDLSVPMTTSDSLRPTFLSRGSPHVNPGAPKSQFAMFSNSLRLFLLAAATAAIVIAGPYNVSAELGDIEVSVNWEADWSAQEVKFFVRWSRTNFRWLLIGFSDHGFWENSDFCIMERYNMIDGWVDKNLKMHRDISQDCELVTVDIEKRTLVFKRKFVTCDGKDYAMELGTTQLILAKGIKKETYLNESTVHRQIAFGQVLQNDAAVKMMEQEPPEKTDVLYIGAIDAHVPPQITTYWCAVVRLDDVIRMNRHHVVKIEANVSPGSEHIVHHMEIFHCADPGNGRIGTFNGNCNDPSKPRESKSCSKVLAAWAMGAGPITYPIQAGMPFGGEKFFPYVMVEIHYNNEAKRADVVDNSGFKITYTDQLRQFDAGIMEVGLIYSDANSIPAGQDFFALSGHCVAECTEKFSYDGIFVFASQLHAHLTGRKLWTSHYRNGVKLGEINRDNHYSPHWQHIQHFDKQKRILPGDTLMTTCVYETRKKNVFTLGGYGIEDEMCVNYLHYYPAMQVEVCKSAVDNGTLHNFFRFMGVQDYRLSISEKYAKVSWTPEAVDKLAELYSSSPLNMDCLNHQGERFPGHPTNWTRVPQPRTFAGSFEKVRANLECPSLND
ncbi:hypothetical protein L596_015346 [Steinernema carpocapsae]|uniref:Tyramine beta-hydroxylase n=1 Tax=Steinernema carpocapsae TaxID=34508 RepID=A0A4U5NFQ0_STECR|nr:hypothetical protein L596_015346 [Steinernema carpocapsae]